MIIQVYSIILLFEKKMYVYFLAHEVMITRMHIYNPFGGGHVYCKSTDVTTNHIRLSGHEFTIISYFGRTYVRCGPVIHW